MVLPVQRRQSPSTLVFAQKAAQNRSSLYLAGIARLLTSLAVYSPERLTPSGLLAALILPRECGGSLRFGRSGRLVLGEHHPSRSPGGGRGVSSADGL